MKIIAIFIILLIGLSMVVWCWYQHHQSLPIDNHKERLLYLTHAIGGLDFYKPGKRDIINGVTYIITRIKSITPTETIDGNYIPCYEVYGIIEQKQLEK